MDRAKTDTRGATRETEADLPDLERSAPLDHSVSSRTDGSSLAFEVTPYPMDGAARSDSAADSALADSSRAGDGEELSSSAVEFIRLMNQVWAKNRRAEGGDSEIDGLAALGACDDEAAGPRLRQIGRFKVLREAGRGGFGVVFEAEDPQIGRRVALKIPLAEVLFDDLLRERFLNEARIVAMLDHPGIVPVFEAGFSDGLCYVVSAWQDGPNLACWLERRTEPVPIKQAATIGLQLADAVAHAHERGVWHRDLKPSNVLVEERLDRERADGECRIQNGGADHLGVRLTDFGLARAAESSSNLTRTNDRLGTPVYMAPEQAEGKHERQGPWTDVYALGAILYELLCGTPPHGKHSDVRTLRRIVEDEPARLSRLRPKTPRDLEAIILKCLEKDPRRRYETAAALAADVRRFLDGVPVEARPVRTIARAARWCRRRPLVAAMSVSLVVSLIIGFAGVVWQWRRAEAGLALAIAEQRRAQDHWLAETRILSEMFRIKYSKNKPETFALIRRRTRAKSLRRYEAILASAEATHAPPEQIATASTKCALLTIPSYPNVPRRRELLDQGLAIWRGLAKDRPDDGAVLAGLAGAEIDAAHVYLEHSEFARSSEHAETAARILAETALARDDLEEERYRLGRVLGQIAANSLEETVKPEDVEATSSLLRRAVGYWRSMIERAPDEREYVSALAQCLKHLVLYEKRFSRWRPALSGERERLDLYIGVSAKSPTGHKSYLVADGYASVAELHERLSEKKEAATAYHEAERILIELEKSQNESGDIRAKAAMLLGRVRDSLGKTAEAADAFVEAATRFGDWSVRYPEVLDYQLEKCDALFWAARLRAELGRQDADAIFRRACESVDKLRHERPTHLGVRNLAARCHDHYARLLVRLGRTVEARSNYAVAAALYRQILAENPLETGFAKDLKTCERALATGMPTETSNRGG